MFIADAHLDLAYNALRGRDITKPAAQQRPDPNDTPTCGLPDLRAGQVGLLCATLFALPRRKNTTLSGPAYETYPQAHTIARNQLTYYHQLAAEGELRLITKSNQVPTTLEDPTNPHRPLPAIILMEGADPILSPEEVPDWFNQGVRIVALSWRKSRYAGGTNHPGPLTAEGAEIVRALDASHIIHDVSHLAEDSFWQLLDQTPGPVIASHSNARHIVPTDRQLSDTMLKALFARGAVVGINFYDEFLLPPDQYKKRRATLKDLVHHIHHMTDLAGTATQVALGTDLDGGVGRDDIPQELTTAADLPKLADALADAHYPDPDIANIMGANWSRYFRQHLPA